MTSTTAIGRAFEQHSMKFLNHHLNMCVRQVGGAGDEGIDLRGWWYTPAKAARVLPVAAASQMGGTRGRMSDWMRELEEAKRTAVALPGWGMGGNDQYTAEGWRREQDNLALAQGVEKEAEDATRRLRVLAQCKAEGKACSGRVVRELEGVMAHFHGTSTFLAGQKHSGALRRWA